MSVFFCKSPEEAFVFGFGYKLAEAILQLIEGYFQYASVPPVLPPPAPATATHPEQKSAADSMTEIAVRKREMRGEMP